MSPPSKFRRARALTTIALVVAGIAFVVQMAAGVTDTPTIPPGLIAIVAAAGVVAFVPARRAPLAGTAAGQFNLGAFIVAGATDRLFDLSPESAFVAAWCMVVALVVASVAGMLATIQAAPVKASSGHAARTLRDAPLR